MEDDIKKNWWIIVVLAMVVVIGSSIVTPTANKIKEQKASIDAVNYTAP